MYFMQKNIQQGESFKNHQRPQSRYYFSKGNGTISLHLQIKKMLFRFQNQKASKALKTFLEPEFADIFERNCKF